MRQNRLKFCLGSHLTVHLGDFVGNSTYVLTQAVVRKFHAPGLVKNNLFKTIIPALNFLNCKKTLPGTIVKTVSCNISYFTQF